MVEEIKKLEADAQLGTLPAWDFRVLHDGEIGVEITWPTEAISALGEGHRSAATGI